jgi:hypothetical protein
MKVKIQKLRPRTKYVGYRIHLPKPIIEAKNWQDINLDLIDKGHYLILKPLKSKKIV